MELYFFTIEDGIITYTEAELEIIQEHFNFVSSSQTNLPKNFLEELKSKDLQLIGGPQSDKSSEDQMFVAGSCWGNSATSDGVLALPVYKLRNRDNRHQSMTSAQNFDQLTPFSNKSTMRSSQGRSIELQSIIFLQLRIMKDFDFRKYIKTNYSLDKKLPDTNFFAMLDFNNLNTLKASNLHKSTYINLGTRSTNISSSLNFREQIEMSMNEQLSPVRLSFLKDQTKNLEGMVLTISNFSHSRQRHKVAIIETSNLYLHVSVVPSHNTMN